MTRHFNGDHNCPINGIELEVRFAEYLEALYGDKWTEHALPREMQYHLIQEQERCLYCGADGAENLDLMDNPELGGHDSFKNTALSCRKCFYKKVKMQIRFEEWTALLADPYKKNALDYYIKKQKRKPEAFVISKSVVKEKKVSKQMRFIAMGGIVTLGKTYIDTGHINLSEFNDDVLTKLPISNFKKPELKYATNKQDGTGKEIPVLVDARIKYEDRIGRESQRDITTKHLFHNGNGERSIFSRCHSRNQYRSFIIKRIKEFVDLSSGEIIDNVEEYLDRKSQLKAA